MNCRNDMFGIQLRMITPFIKKINRPSWYRFKTSAALYIVTFIVEDIGNHFNGYICLDSFSNVSNNDYLFLYKTIYDRKGALASSVPDRLFFISTAITCKKQMKEMTAILRDVKEDEGYRNLAHLLSSTISETATFPFIVNIAVKITDIIRRRLGNADNASIACVHHYLNRQHGDWDKNGTIYLTKSTQNAIFNFELVIYNNELPADEIPSIVLTQHAPIYHV